MAENVHEFRVALQLVGIRRHVGPDLPRFPVLVQIEKFRATIHERERGLVPSKPDHRLPIRPQSMDQRGEVGVGRDQAECVHLSGIENIHRLDQERHVRGIFPFHQIKLLHRLDRVFMQDFLPPRERLVFPVSVGPADVHHAVRCQLGDDKIDFCRWRVVRIDEQGNAVLRGSGETHGVKAIQWRKESD